MLRPRLGVFLALLSLAATPSGIVDKVPIESMDTWSDLHYMQQMSTVACTNAPSKQRKTLYDIRDNSDYRIMKLDDEKCWMVENLRLVNKTISGWDSDVTSDWTVPASVVSVNSWGSDNTQQRVYYNNEKPSDGAYYSWCAATAGSCSSATTEGAVAENSICPKEWRLPTKAEYDNLLTAAGIGSNKDGVAKIMGSPYNFTLTGMIGGNSFGNVGSWGYYWTNMSYSSGGVYYLYFGNSTVSTTFNNGRSNGYSIRCIAK